MPHATEEMSLLISNTNDNITNNDNNGNVSTSSSVTSSPLSSASLKYSDNMGPPNTFVCCGEIIQNIPDFLEHTDTAHPGFINDQNYGMLSFNASITYSQGHGIPISIPNNRNNGVYGHAYLTNGKKILMNEADATFNNEFYLTNQIALSSSNYCNYDYNNNYTYGLKDPNDASVILGNQVLSDRSSVPGSLDNDPLIFGSFPYNDDNNNQYSTASSPSSDNSSISGSLEDDPLFFVSNSSISSTSTTYSPETISATYSPTSSAAATSSLVKMVNNNAATYIPNNVLVSSPTTYSNSINTTTSTAIASSSTSSNASLVNNNQTAATYNIPTTQYPVNYSLFYNVPSVCTNNNGTVDYASRYPRIQPKTSITLADICVDPTKSSKKHLSTQSEDKYPYKCTILGCPKVYKNANGLKYHNEHGHVEQNDNGRSKPFPCRVAGCNKSYGSKGGLIYHINHSHPQDVWALP
ncbi:14400_t:CDS:2 [Entrophospora sp. SA101]|nr:14400_t:CDS:2 [Entrophospora sp. SA101]